MTLSRRDLFAWLRPAPADDPPAPSPPPLPLASAFSLDGFYRDRASPAAIPTFAVRAAPTIATTAVGQGPGRADAVIASLAAPAPVPGTLVPMVIAAACLAERSFCSVCVERCPRPGAIVVTAGRPRVVAEQCDGCGRCIAVCPAPTLALALVPRPVPGGAS